MKSVVACIVLALSVSQLVSADGSVSGSISGSVATSVSLSTSGGASGALAAVSQVCSNVITLTGLGGALNILNGLAVDLQEADSDLQLLCMADIGGLLSKVTSALKTAGAIVVSADGTLTYVPSLLSALQGGVVLSLTGGATVGVSAEVQVILTAVTSALGGISGGLVNGLVLGLTSGLSLDLLSQLNLAVDLFGSVNDILSCVSLKCPK